MAKSISKKHIYGYKVCVKENGNKLTVYFKTYTYSQAIAVKNYYIQYPPNSYENKLEFIIVPIAKRKVQAGIWRECPF